MYEWVKVSSTGTYKQENLNVKSEIDSIDLFRVIEAIEHLCCFKDKTFNCMQVHSKISGLRRQTERQLAILNTNTQVLSMKLFVSK